MIERIPKWLRWLLFLPVSLGAGYVVAGLVGLLQADGAGVPSRVLAYVAAFLSGLAYICAALYTAYRVVPSHKRIVVTILGILILGDLSFIHLVLQSDVLPQPSGPAPGEAGVGVILDLLRADDLSGLPNGGVVKMAGVLTGLFLAWRIISEKKSREGTS